MNSVEPLALNPAAGHGLAASVEVRAEGRPGRLARPLRIERACDPDREAMLAALRVALGLPRAFPAGERQRR